MNASGQLVFESQTRDYETLVYKNEGIWSDVSGSLALVALNRSYAPGTPSGAVFDNPVGIAETELLDGDYEWYIKSWNAFGKVWSDGMIFNVAE